MDIVTSLVLPIALLYIVGFFIPYVIVLALFGNPRLRYIAIGALGIIPFIIAQAFVQLLTYGALSHYSIWVVAPTLALIAALFQETGKLVMIKLCKIRGRANACGIGLGIGLLEVTLAALGIATLYLAHAQATSRMATMLLSATIATILAPIERLLATLFHVATVLMLYIGIIRRRLAQYYAIALTIHFIVDTLALLTLATKSLALLVATYLILTAFDVAALLKYAKVRIR